MSSRKTPRVRPKTVYVYNTTPSPRVIDQAGNICFGSTVSRVDPEDPIARALIERGVLIVKEEA